MSETAHLTLTREFREITCGRCGVVYWIPGTLYSELRSEHGSFYCPNGHCRVFTGETDGQKADRLGRELAAEKTRAAAIFGQLESAERLASSRAKSLRRLKSRVANGVCPCCKRHFSNLGTHMKKQHPGFANTEQAG